MNTHTPPCGSSQEHVIDGVRCAEFRHQGRLWRLGSCVPGWRAELPLLGDNPEAEALEALAARGIWLNPAEDAAPLAVVCCGQGAVWPHMGRELYDRVPAARAAMDRIAAIASWDVLSLLDEDSVETIGQTRWQQPYLFLLEYAQWSYVASLGLRPRMMAGHSLGEMIALCLAGAYSPETAWNMIDTRARHTADIEAASTRSSGMMAVHAGGETIAALLEAYPGLYVSNYNAPEQVILSGPRDVLQAARKSLRKQRVPAMLLNVTVAFHNPAMRVLHNTAIQRLRVLEMRPEGPELPVMSNTTAGLYPQSRAGVCEYISVLDENSVRWVECVRSMWKEHGIRDFLETGPQDTLCGLITAIEPAARCLPAARKGRELEALRQAVARLYALGHVPRSVFAAGSRGADATEEPDRSAAEADRPAAQAAPSPAGHLPDAAFTADVLDQLAATLELDRASLRPDQDLRHDLGLRSSRFPLLLQDAEQRFGITIRFEDMLNVLTVGDFVHALHGILHPEQAAASRERGVRRIPRIAPMRRWRLAAAPDGSLSALPAVIDPQVSGLPVSPGQDILVLAGSPLPFYLLTGLAALGCSLHIFSPAPLPEASEARHALEQLGARVTFAHGSMPVPEQGTLPQGLLILPGAGLDAADAVRRIAPRWVTRIEALPRDVTRLPGLIHALEQPLPGNPPTRTILLPLSEELRAGRLLRSQYAGDMLLRDLLFGRDDCILWGRLPLPAQEGAQEEATIPGISPAPARTVSLRTGQRAVPERWPLTRPEPPHGGHAGPQPWEGSCHFSTYADPLLATLAARRPTPAPAGHQLEAMLEAACQHLPWLVPTGLADIRWRAPLEVARGITRECTLTASTSVWFRPDDHLSRFCPTLLQARDLGPDGRRKATSSDICSALVLLSPASRTIPPLWSGADRDNSPGWTDMLPQTAAPASYAGYTFPAYLLEAILRLAEQCLRESAPDDCHGMRLDGIGFIYFMANAPCEGVRLDVRPTFRQPGRIQFDAQATAPDGRILLTCNTIEYLRPEATPDASAY